MYPTAKSSSVLPARPWGSSSPCSPGANPKSVSFLEKASVSALNPQRPSALCIDALLLHTAGDPREMHTPSLPPKTTPGERLWTCAPLLGLLCPAQGWPSLLGLLPRDKDHSFLQHVGWDQDLGYTQQFPFQDPRGKPAFSSLCGDCRGVSEGSWNGLGWGSLLPWGSARGRAVWGFWECSQ